MKISEYFRVTTSRPLNALDKVSIAELAQYTDFDPCAGITTMSSADQALRSEWKWEIKDTDLNFLDFKALQIWFKDGSSISLKS